jgi:hypothetical protein
MENNNNNNSNSNINKVSSSQIEAKKFIEENDLWVDNINIDFYLSQGAEQIKIPFQLYHSQEELFFYFVLTC